MMEVVGKLLILYEAIRERYLAHAILAETCLFGHSFGPGRLRVNENTQK